jgi:N6-adenosine-specific RNA methylase IME4
LVTWFKDRAGNGSWLRGQTESCIMAIRGHPVVTLTNQTTALSAPRRGHSEKPDEFYSLVESLCPAPRYLELFARKARPGWDVWGDEAPSPAQPLHADDAGGIPPFLHRATAEGAA